MKRDPTRTRARILAAAVHEFGARGFEAARVDRIAARARVNKALLYYYFGNKRKLYHAVLVGQADGLIAALQPVIESPLDARAKLDAYVDTLARFLDGSNPMTRLMLRELAEGGRHLDPDVLRRMTVMPGMIAALVQQGRRERVFADRNPLMVHLVLVGTTLFMAANAGIRTRIARMGLAQPPLDIDAVIAELQTIARSLLQKES
jgi:AcrR family transcriptional regulator